MRPGGQHGVYQDVAVADVHDDGGVAQLGDLHGGPCIGGGRNAIGYLVGAAPLHFQIGMVWSSTALLPYLMVLPPNAYQTDCIPEDPTAVHRHPGVCGLYGGRNFRDCRYAVDCHSRRPRAAQGGILPF